MDILEKYLKLDNLNLFIFITIIVTVQLYVQQEYVFMPQMNDIPLFNEALKSQLIDQFVKYRWLSFIIAPLILFLRITIVGYCLFVGGILFDSWKSLNYRSCFNVALKADIILVSFSIVYTLLVVIFGYEKGLYLMNCFSLIAFFDMNTTEPWLLAPLALFNLFELLYWIFLAKLLSKELNNKYFISLSFVISTYGVGFVLYILFVVFILLFVYQ